MNAVEEAEELPSWERHGWADLVRVSKYLRPDELRVLKLARMGKTPSEVAKILCLPSRQLADKELRRVREVVCFYVEHARAMRRIEGLKLSTARQQILDLFVLQRQSYLDVASALGVGKFEVVRRIRLLLDHLHRNGYSEVAELLADTWSNRRLRISMKGAVGNRLEWKGKRRAMVTEPWRFDLRNLVLGLVGKVYYDWGGQKILWNAMSGSADCSGLVLECLKKVGRLPKNFRDATAQDLFDYYARTRVPALCDLAFYGSNNKAVVHVMFYLGKGQLPADGASVGLNLKECVVGMCNGDHGLQATDARWLGAGLFVRTSPKYRKDFLGYGVVR